ncbi:hypothetical protein BGZ73_003348 [Actinomortierella ambigua]|nr:hypothetical protein BGZ73_003348 [Actinomortierella ambigua]
MRRTPRPAAQTLVCYAALLTALGTLLQQQHAVVHADLARPQQHHHHDQKPVVCAKSSKPDLHLALTSLDDRLIAYQYTDPAAPLLTTTTIPAKPTDTAVHKSHTQKKAPGGSRHGSEEPDSAQNNLPPSPLCHEGDPCHLSESHDDQPATEWTDLHISSLAQPPPPSGVSHGLQENIPVSIGQAFGDPATRDNSSGMVHHHVPFSPREELDSAATAATTITFSSEPTSDSLVQRVHPTPKDGDQREESKEREDKGDDRDESIMPEPTLSIIKAPTLHPVTTVSEGDADHAHNGLAHSQGGIPGEATQASHASPTGPPTPEPEPTATDQSTAFDGHNNDEDRQHLSRGGIGSEKQDKQQQPVTSIHRETEVQTSSGGETNQNSVSSKSRKRVKRVTTLIIENMTIIRHPPKETLSMHRQRPAKEDHVLFDSGIEGDMIVSIVSEEEAKAKKKHGSTTPSRLNDEL